MVDFSKALTGTTAGGQEISRREDISDAPFLSAKFWEEGTSIVGEVISVHKSANGPYVGLELIEPVSVEVADAHGEVTEHEVVRIGNLAGIGLARREALRNQKNKYFAVGDTLQIVCTGITPPKQEGHSASPNFEIKINRTPVPF